ncbi:hypothetical protein B0I26_10618 [Anoxybacillus vitaminiphilus]|uniref:Uncharacterized protein n=1 Tax=Paranoxybacillus vitaminiphilus TaxID=581036 RepID=A0A327YED2_9BACL|nr:YhcU family protein [Anoxybacillus vitaminiphilus]RAK19398.1 hypothetical protein B0I26_10618 [Anoxybacillus vitaminiphilus]
MKIVYAATKEQEEYINCLINYFYSNIFPHCFDDSEITVFEHLGILSLQEEQIKYNGTMKEAFEIISSLQSLIAVIESLKSNHIREHHRKLFQKNIRLLERYGISFPFLIEQFTNRRKAVLSMYSQPANQWLI